MSMPSDLMKSHSLFAVTKAKKEDFDHHADRAVFHLDQAHQEWKKHGYSTVGSGPFEMASHHVERAREAHHRGDADSLADRDAHLEIAHGHARLGTNVLAGSGYVPKHQIGAEHGSLAADHIESAQYAR